jgi:hypothetical protein
VRLEGLGQLKNPMTPGFEPATFRLVPCAPSSSITDYRKYLWFNFWSDLYISLFLTAYKEHSLLFPVKNCHHNGLLLYINILYDKQLLSTHKICFYINVPYLRESNAYLNFQNLETKNSICWRM